MKRLAVLLLALSMMLSFAGCGDVNDTDDSQELSEKISETESEEEIYSLAYNGDGAFVPGELSENEYKSAWLGLMYTAGESVILATKEEISSANGVVSASGTIDYSALPSVYDMMATNDLDGSNVSIVAEQIGGDDMTEDDYIALFKSRNEDIIDRIVYSDTVDEEFCGRTYRRVDYYFTIDSEANGEKQSFNLFQTVLVRRVGNRMAAITFTYLFDSQYEALVSDFSSL